MWGILFFIFASCDPLIDQKQMKAKDFLYTLVVSNWNVTIFRKRRPFFFLFFKILSFAKLHDILFKKLVLTLLVVCGGWSHLVSCCKYQPMFSVCTSKDSGHTIYFRIRHSTAHVWTILNKMASFGVNIYRPSASEHGQNITNTTMIWKTNYVAL